MNFFVLSASEDGTSVLRLRIACLYAPSLRVSPTSPAHSALRGFVRLVGHHVPPLPRPLFARLGSPSGSCTQVTSNCAFDARKELTGGLKRTIIQLDTWSDVIVDIRPPRVSCWHAVAER